MTRPNAIQCLIDTSKPIRSLPPEIVEPVTRARTGSRVRDRAMTEPPLGRC